MATTKPAPTLTATAMSLGGRRWAVAIATTSIFTVIMLTFIGIFQPGMIPQQMKDTAAAMTKNKPSVATSPNFGELHALYDAASNRTLGLDSIQFINLPHRHDRYDSAFIQAYISDIDIQRFPAVLADTLQDTGFPPMENHGRLANSELACWRAHANIWQMMLEKRIPALLVLEADAAWDINLRPIFGSLNQPFRELLRADNPDASIAVEEDDPWAARGGLWDMISVGHCSGWHPSSAQYRIYDDEHAPRSGYMWEEKNLNSKRIIYRAGGAVCTTGYIVSLCGAAKLLIRSAFNLNDPVDLLINNMAKANELIVYDVMQQPIAQWVYVPGIGMDAREANTDMHPEGDHPDSGDSDDAPDGWPEAKKTMSVWKLKPQYKDAAFKEMALQVAWNRVKTKGRKYWKE